ncbi:hypothetical protein CI109_104339 [Kwoniella shandongensis]|uniref:Uncharacterized protein n=1 Tax=Kwoniella shandongensis TaxID=1734106 RepID=A0A5M6BX29_9TREE|nr:uncharacterized protein CI109_004265 [Kwoniella shandongensis]KAA5527448.1 hypothetical protein CI109_004265 [Kwoniella shandongensis]
MSDSEDDFMSDKFLVDPSSSSSSGNKKRTTKPIEDSATATYTARRSAQALKNLRAGQAKNQLKLKDLEEIQRRKGLETSLFEQNDLASGSGGGGGAGGGGNKAMELMMKMGWKVGEGLGKKRSPSPPAQDQDRDRDQAKRTKVSFGDDEEEEEDAVPRGGIGSRPKSKKPSFLPTSNTEASTTTKGRLEPIRISMWSGRTGLSARPPSPPPLPEIGANMAGRNPDALDPAKMERLGKETEGFRERQRREWADKERERKGSKARERLREFDAEKGVKFHPLHVFPSDPLGTLPRPLLRLIYPSQVLSPSRSRSPSPDPIVSHGKEENLSAAERMREQIRRDMLSDLAGDDDDDEEEGVVRFGTGTETITEKKAHGDDQLRGRGKTKDEYEGVKWEEHVPGVKRVLSMDPATYLTFVVDQLRHEHMFCFWCAYKYKSFGEMEGPGGCPGEEEDDH